MSDFNAKVIAEFRGNEGKVGGYFANNTLLLLHTIGAKSGKPRTNPVVTYEDGGRLVIVASKGGAPTHPDWYYNILANPEVEVEFGSEKFRAKAAIASEPERSRLYQGMADRLDAFKEYREKAGRVIPVVTLTRLG